MGTQNEKREAISHEFLEWLKNKKELKYRSAKNVLSHLTRASKLIDVHAPELDGDDLAFRLSKLNQFQELTPSVKSHLRRSVRLYKEFLRDYFRQKNRSLF